MIIKISGKAKAMKDLEKALDLMREAQRILWQLPNEIELEVTEDSREVSDSVQEVTHEEV